MSSATRRLVALDIDGTVLLEDETFSPGVVDAVHAAVAGGHLVTLATGRSWEATSHVLRGLDIQPEYVVCSNGAAILIRDDASESGYIRHFTEQFDCTDVIELLETHLPDANYLVELPDGSRLYTHYVDDWGLHRANAKQVDLADMKGLMVSRVVVVSPEHTEADFVEMVDRMGLNQVSYAVGWTAWLDIAPKGVDKSTALARVCELTGFAAADVVVIGDGRNDIGMFRWAAENGGRAFAMGQAPEEVSHEATDITDDVEDGGVATAFQTLGLA
ncbi:HAD family hydrolase [Microbacterium petrolearium]|jgi:Cof subfamily protein (haloacid dehalogenase superfamily)